MLVKVKTLKIPRGLTEFEVIKALNEIMDNLAHKYRFGVYDAEEIRQQGILFGLEGLDGFDINYKQTTTTIEKLKSFLYIHIRNRLINFKRDKYGKVEAKQNVTCALSINNIDDQEERGMKDETSVYEKLILDEIKQVIKDKLSPEMYREYRKLVLNRPISRVRKAQVFQAVKNIIEEYENS